LTIQLTKFTDGTFSKPKIIEKSVEEINFDYDMDEIRLAHENWIQRLYSHNIGDWKHTMYDYVTFQHP